MLLADNTFHPEGVRLLGLASAVRKLGIGVPKTVSDELAIYKELLKSRTTAQNEYDNAVRELRTIDPARFNEAKAEVIAKSHAAFAVANGIDGVLIDTAARRLHNAIYDAIGEWEAETVAQFNETVARHRLNEQAESLPDFANQRAFNAFDMGEAQGRAARSWREAAAELHPIWHTYTRIAAYHGHDIGPSDPNEMSINMFTACVLGDPGSFARCQSAAHELARIAAGVDHSRPYTAISPYVVTAITGYPLRLSTLQDAAAIRARIQPA
jgi:hypothetical protein